MQWRAWLGIVSACAAPVVSTDRDDTDSDGATDAPVDTPTDVADSDTAGDSDAPLPAVWSWGDEVVCADAAARELDPYTVFDPGGDWSNQTWPDTPVPLFTGGGVTVADVDDDGVFDLFRTSDAGGFRWYALAASGAVDRTAELGVLPWATSGVTVVDVEGDGDLDLHLTVWGGPDRVYLQDGGVFTDAAVALGLAGGATERTVASSWADADGDGDLDVFVAAHGDLGLGEALPPGEPSHLYLQQPDGTFVDLVPALPDGHALREAHTFLGGWLQLDDDLTPELAVINDFGFRHPNLAVEVVDGGLVVLPNQGFESQGTHMGLGLGDLNGDGREDLVVPEFNDVFLFLSGSVGWFEAAAAAGVVRDAAGTQETGWGAELADLDNDGDLDALVAFGFLHPDARIADNGAQQPDAVYVQGPVGFSDRAPAWGLDQAGVGRGFVVVDLNRDGWLDVVKQDLAGPVTVHQAACGAASWLGLSLRQPGPNPRGIGATVVVVDGRTRWMRVVRAGGTSYASAGPADVHVGLGSRTRVDRVEVHWPDGRVDVSTDVALNRWGRVSRE